MPYKKKIVLLAVGLLIVATCPNADAYRVHFPDAQSTRDHMNGDYETRVEIERQWEYERRVIDLENERERDAWQDRMDENERIMLDNLNIEKTW